MSCYTIYYKNGAKMMRPVLTAAEYRELRNTEKQKKIVCDVRNGDEKLKLRLLQFNYSCMPNEDGSLKGSMQITTTVGMDVDHIAKEQMQEVKERILAKKEELGLLMLELSARGEGYHLVFKRKFMDGLAEGKVLENQEMNLRWASELLGVKYDEGAKDITRVFFTTTASEEDLLFLDDALFEQGTAIQAEVRVDAGNPAASSPSSSMQPVTNPSGVVASSHIEAERVSLFAFDLCVQNAGLKAEEMDIWGEHNWHSNLMAVLSVGLPKLMSKEQLLAVVAKRLPNYAQTEDCQKLINYFYENYTADKGFMSTTLREINARAQKLALRNDNDDDNDNDNDDENEKQLRESWTPPTLPKRIPRLMELLVNNYDPRFREMLLLSSLPVLSAHASHFRATYLNGRVIGPQQYVAVIGGSGKGKGNCTSLYKEMVQYTLQDSDEREWEKVKENAELRDKMTNAKERPPKYHPKLRLFETTSKSSILELQTNLGKNGMLLGQFSEVDGLSSASRAAYSDISVLLRKGWDMDMHRQFYMSDATCNSYAQMSISLLMAGTVKAMLERMFSDTNCEGGLMQRCIPVLVPRAKRTFRPPRQNFLTDDEKKERDALLIELYQKDLSLGEETLLLDTPLTNRAIGQWFDELEERYNDGLLTEAEADLSHRCGEFMLRAAIPLIALYGKETKEIVDFSRWVGETAHYAMCRIYGMRVQKDITSANELLALRLDARKTVEPLLDKMPQVFTMQQFKEVRIKEGQSPDVKMLLSRYCKNGKLERVGKGVYRKMVDSPPTPLS